MSDVASKDENERLRAAQSANNPHRGSTFDSWLDEEGIRSEVEAAALVEENAALRRRLDNACAALRLGMGHLKGFYPVPYKEAEVLATMQAAIDDANAKEKP